MEGQVPFIDAIKKKLGSFSLSPKAKKALFEYICLWVELKENGVDDALNKKTQMAQILPEDWLDTLSDGLCTLGISSETNCQTLSHNFSYNYVKPIGVMTRSKTKEASPEVDVQNALRIGLDSSARGNLIELFFYKTLDSKYQKRVLDVVKASSPNVKYPSADYQKTTTDIVKAVIDAVHDEVLKSNDDPRYYIILTTIGMLIEEDFVIFLNNFFAAVDKKSRNGFPPEGAVSFSSPNNSKWLSKYLQLAGPIVKKLRVARNVQNYVDIIDTTTEQLSKTITSQGQLASQVKKLNKDIKSIVLKAKERDDEQKQEIADYKQQLEQLNEELNIARQSGNSNELLEDQLFVCKNQNELQEEEIKRQNEQIKQLQKKVNDLKALQDQQKEQSTSKKSKAAALNNKTIANLTQQLQNAIEELKRAKSEAERSQAAQREAERQLEASRDENQRLSLEMENLSRVGVQNGQLERELKSSQEEVQQLNDSLRASEQNRMRLETELIRSNERNGSLTERLNELSSQPEQASQNSNGFGNLEDELRKAEQNDSDEELRKENQNLMEQINALVENNSNTIDNLTRQLSEQRAASEREIASLQVQLQQQTQALDETRRAAQELQRQLEKPWQHRHCRLESGLDETKRAELSGLLAGIRRNAQTLRTLSRQI